MKCITPNPELPFSNLNMLSYNGLPSRPQRTQLRNMTGIYLGHDSNTSQSRKNTIPPLARGRGMSCRQKTPVERRRYLPDNDPDFVSHPLLYLYNAPVNPPILLPYTDPMILRIPNIRPKQQQRVESLRSRDEHRGFNPMPIKKAKPRTVTTWKTEERVQQSTPRGSSSPSEFSGLPKKTGRNYVAVANSGFSHLESLGPPHGWNRSDGECSLTSSMTEDIRAEDSLAGLEDCYRKICKQGNMTGMQSLLPHRKSGLGITTKTKGVNTPLTIRSFRNPQNPHPVVQYSDPQARPQTMAASRPAVPAPYYYSSKNLPKTAEESASRVRLQRMQDSGKSRDKILAAPGVGALTRSSNRKRGTPSDPPSCIEGTTPPTNPNQAKMMDDPGDYYRELRVPSGTPASSATNLAKLGTTYSVVSLNSDLAETTTAADDGQTAISILEERNSEQLGTGRGSPSSDSSVDADILEVANSNNSNSIDLSNLSLTEKEKLETNTKQGSINPQEVVSLEAEDHGVLHNTETMADQIDMDTKLVREDQFINECVEGRSGSTIIVSVEDVEGHSQTLNIQEEDFIKSATVTKMRPLLRFSQIAEAVREASKRKQMEFQKLLEEHAELVSQIEEMEQKNRTVASNEI